MAKLVVHDALPIAEAAQRPGRLAHGERWAERCRRHSTAGMTDRLSSPHRSPRTTPPKLVAAGSCGTGCDWVWARLTSAPAGVCSS
ncbi:hypothetical protein DMP15_09215 [Pseudonocardia sp. UM4_GMWB1]|uniref:leucine zipper domain-containing protein n=1 Tax=Pseudonocardia sp. UM4_GMWB1 TaxID=2212989 RepID=UPI0030948F29